LQIEILTPTEIILGKPTLKQILDAQINQVRLGKTYLSITKGLLDADAVILQVAPTFFSLTMAGNIDLSQMALARLYDQTKGAVTVRAMLLQARNQANSFQKGNHQQVIAAIAKSEKTVTGLEPVLASIRQRRNEWLAHLDPRTVADPKALSAKAKLTVPDLERAFKETENILRELSSLYEGVIGDLHFIGGDDYKAALNWIRRARCDFIENYEKEFGRWTGPRPKDCSRKPYDLL
jgi:hypothetical protein